METTLSGRHQCKDLRPEPHRQNEQQQYKYKRREQKEGKKVWSSSVRERASESQAG